MIDAEYTEELELIAALKAEGRTESVAEEIVDDLLFGIGAALDEYFPFHKRGGR